MDKNLQGEDIEKQEDINNIEGESKKEIKNQKGKNFHIKVGILTIILLLIALLAITCNKDTVKEIARDIPTLDRFLIGEGGTEGAFDFSDRDSVLRELQKNADNSNVRYIVNNSPRFSTSNRGRLGGRIVSNLLFENPKENNRLWRAIYILDETEEILYESPVIKPNQYLSDVNYDDLNKQLENGSYPTTVLIYSYHPETLQETSLRTFGITLNIAK